MIIIRFQCKQKYCTIDANENDNKDEYEEIGKNQIIINDTITSWKEKKI